MGKSVGAGRRRAWGALAAFCIAVAGALLPTTPAAAAEADTIHALVNDARTESGLASLVRSSALDSVAASWATQLAASGQLSHNPDVGGQIPGGWSSWGENVAQGHPNGAEMHVAWMNSPGHRANVLGDFTDLGVAFLPAGGTTWGVEVFATYEGSGGVPPPAPAPPSVPAPEAEPEPAPEPVPEASPSAPVATPSPSARQSDRAEPSADPVAARTRPPDDPTPFAVGALIAAVIATTAFVAWRLAGKRRHP